MCIYNFSLVLFLIMFYEENNSNYLKFRKLHRVKKDGTYSDMVGLLDLHHATGIISYDFSVRNNGEDFI